MCGLKAAKMNDLDQGAIFYISIFNRMQTHH